MLAVVTDANASHEKRRRARRRHELRQRVPRLVFKAAPCLKGVIYACQRPVALSQSVAAGSCNHPEGMPPLYVCTCKSCEGIAGGTSSEQLFLYVHVGAVCDRLLAVTGCHQGRLCGRYMTALNVCFWHKTDKGCGETLDEICKENQLILCSCNLEIMVNNVRKLQRFAYKLRGRLQSGAQFE